MIDNIYIYLAILLALSLGARTADAQRTIPEPLANHPGNIFLKGESVVVNLPDEDGWKLVDYDNKQLATVEPGVRRAEPGSLPIGFYRYKSGAADKWVSFAVLEPLKAPTPLDSPISIDVAMAWFYPTEQMPAVASLCRLAGVNRVRDRLNWEQMEPERGKFETANKYDDSARIQSAAGLQILQVNHFSPVWANPVGRRFPLDLRDAYNFYREMARRWKGEVAAFEPWNEADIAGFGGHTGSEMAFMQKASYLGLKDGNPNVIGCLNVFAIHSKAQLQDMAANRTWPYFDTYDLHHYEPLEGYPKLYADHRAVSAGRPIWVTECAIPVEWSGDTTARELSEENLRLQSERLVKVYAASLFEGTAATYYFILGNYSEGRTQFGIIRADLTPRPAYSSLAAVGRILADAKPIGRMDAGDSVRAYAFKAKPDGREKTVVVAWANTEEAELALPGKALEVYDHIGRLMPVNSSTLKLTAAPIFVVMPSRSLNGTKMIPAPAAPKRLPGKPSRIVIQSIWPEDKVNLFQSAYRVSSTEPTDGQLAVYNFGATPVDGTISAKSADGWRVEGLKPLHIEPMGRELLSVRFLPAKSGGHIVETISFKGKFGSNEEPTASIRLAPQGNSLGNKPGSPVANSATPSAWELMVSGGPAPSAVAEDGGVTFEATPTGDPWFYPRLKLPAVNPVPKGVVGLACTVTLLEGDAQFRVIFDKSNGSSYLSELSDRPKLGTAVKTVALFDGAVHGDGWSKPDTKSEFDPVDLVGFKIGCNSKGGKVRFRVSDVRWVKP